MRQDSNKTATKGDIQDLEGDIQNLKGDIQDLKGNVQDLKGNVQGLKSNFQGLKQDFQDLKQDMQCFKTEIQKDMQDFRTEIKADLKHAIKQSETKLYGLIKMLFDSIEEIKAKMLTREEHQNSMELLDAYATELKDIREERILREKQNLHLDDTVNDHEKRIKVLENKSICS